MIDSQRTVPWAEAIKQIDKSSDGSRVFVVCDPKDGEPYVVGPYLLLFTRLDDVTMDGENRTLVTLMSLPNMPSVVIRRGGELEGAVVSQSIPSTRTMAATLAEVIARFTDNTCTYPANIEE